jgi:hypothetical protein
MNTIIVIFKFMALIAALTVFPYLIWQAVLKAVRFVNDERFEYRFTLLKNAVMTEGVNKKNYLKVKLEFDTFEVYASQMDRVTSLAQAFHVRFKKYVKPVELKDVHQQRIENSIKNLTDDIVNLEDQKAKTITRKERLRIEELQDIKQDDIELLKTLL